MNDTSVITRFAPSPTGFLHIGNARTALFNWLFARASGGKFRLRVEDTDRVRSTPEATDAILSGLRWLGLKWDGEYISQFARKERHFDVVCKLLDNGGAYKCFATRQEIQQHRAEAIKLGTHAPFASPWRDAGSATYPEREFVVRLKTPLAGQTSIRDEVHGKVTWKNKSLDDLILLRSDGSPTYNLAVVVDDHDMGVTHIIRGDDHLSNAAKQTLVYQSLGWRIPQFAHVPLIHGEDGKKLSKREGARGLDYYREAGYPPEAVRNYLARLGWSHGDAEFFTTEEAIGWFSLDGLRKSPARLDSKRLADLSRRHIASTEDAALLVQALDFADSAKDQYVPEVGVPKLRTALPCLKTRAKNLRELLDQAKFIWTERPVPLVQKANKLLNENTREILRDLNSAASSAEWSRNSLEAVVKDLAESRGVGFGKIAQPLRAALTGRVVSPSVVDIMIILGRAETAARLVDSIDGQNPVL